MDHQDHLFNNIKSAAEKAESQDFPGMERVWSRIDAKLDTRVEKKNKNYWRILILAASVLLFVSIGYHFLKADKSVDIPQNAIVKSTETSHSKNELNADTTAVAIQNPSIKPNAHDILKKQITSQNEVASHDTPDAFADRGDIESDSVLSTKKETIHKNTFLQPVPSNWYGNRKFESRSVVHQEEEPQHKQTDKTVKEDAKKIDPLLILNGEISKKQLENLDEDEIESILELPEPLYIINSVYYTEKELFGPNPTSPYAPLNKQKIETISVLQPEEAVKIYGEKGKKGIVIITTKNGKPLDKK
ncbi:hypothetical protein [Flavobacterium aciduliphilum]|uniref:TonB-dependent SusC/RagA subfamily outer membrane receptor n=1 Tax=Flavobacterium aciduliphilum TaxID=1101402 RepID=A0A328YMY7_9FLAO|nr:hypothetical protein [Flavobacterium aciduliphilum]RAR75468.1 hypothetical protein CLV55_101164 [Flavobacterium aciduliphilum]